ncbi:MAG TPA: tape measure protein [Coleofasciculaceae cyanobacterium]|jgi:tape measure domain-containing protein
MSENIDAGSLIIQVEADTSLMLDQITQAAKQSAQSVSAALQAGNSAQAASLSSAKQKNDLLKEELSLSQKLGSTKQTQAQQNEKANREALEASKQEVKAVQDIVAEQNRKNFLEKENLQLSIAQKEAAVDNLNSLVRLKKAKQETLNTQRLELANEKSKLDLLERQVRTESELKRLGGKSGPNALVIGTTFKPDYDSLAKIRAEAQKNKILLETKLGAPTGLAFFWRELKEGAANSLGAGLMSIPGRFIGLLMDGFKTAAGFLRDQISSALDAANARESSVATLSATADSSQVGEQGIQFATDTALKYGNDIQSSRDAYIQMYANIQARVQEVGGTLEDTRKQAEFLYEGLSNMFRARGLSTDQIQGAFLAVNQILAKNQVQAEELKGQLAERLPGAIALFAKALGVTTQELGELMKKGLSADTIFDFVRSGRTDFEKLTGVLNTANVAVTNLGNQGVLLQEKFGKAIQPFEIATLNAAADILKQISGDIFGSLNKQAEDFKAYLEANPQIIQNISAEIGKLLKGGLNYAAEKAQEMLEYLKKNPTAIQDAITKAGAFVESLKPVLELMSAIALKSLETASNLALGIQNARTLKNGQDSAGQQAGLSQTTLDANRKRAEDKAKEEGLIPSSGVYNDRVEALVTTYNSESIAQQSQVGASNTFAGRRRTVPGQEYNAGRDGGSRSHAGEDFDIVGESTEVRAVEGGTVYQIIPNFTTDNEGNPVGAVYLRTPDGGTEVIAEYKSVNAQLQVGSVVSAGGLVGSGESGTGVIHRERMDSSGAHLDPSAYWMQQGLLSVDANGNYTIKGGNGGSAATSRPEGNSSSGNETGPSNRDRFLSIIASRESDLNTSAVNKSEEGVAAGTPRGAFQFIGDTRQGAIANGYGDAWAGDLNDQAQVAWNLIKAEFPEAATAIDEGNFDKAMDILNGTWTSLNGGAEARSGVGNEYTSSATTPVSIGGPRTSINYVSGSSTPEDPGNSGKDELAKSQAEAEAEAQRKRDKYAGDLLSIEQRANLDTQRLQIKAARDAEDTQSEKDRAAIDANDTNGLRLFDYGVQVRGITRTGEDDSLSTQEAIRAVDSKISDVENGKGVEGVDNTNALNALTAQKAQLEANLKSISDDTAKAIQAASATISQSLKKMADDAKVAQEQWMRTAATNLTAQQGQIADANFGLLIAQSDNPAELQYQQASAANTNATDAKVATYGNDWTDQQKIVDDNSKYADSYLKGLGKTAEQLKEDGGVQYEIYQAYETLINNAKERQGIIHQQANNERTLGGIQQQTLDAQEIKRKEELQRTIASNQNQSNDKLGDLTAARLERTQGVFAANALRRQQGEARIRRELELQVDAAKRAGTYTQEWEQTLRGIADLDISNLSDQFKDIGTTIKDSLEGSFKSFLSSAITGTQSLKEMFISLFQDIAGKLADLALNELFAQVLGGVSGAAGGFGSRGGIGDFASGGGQGGDFSAGGIGGLLQGGLSLFSALPKFADGGLVNKSTLAMIGEGAHPEAIVPLPNGRSIGVELKGNKGGGGDVNTNITVHVGSNGAVSSSGAKAGQMSRELEAAVVQVVQKHRRPGGALAN